MTNKNELKMFESRQVRSVWDETNEKWWFSVVDVVAVLTEQEDHQLARNYWKVLKKRLKDEGNETVTNCNRLKMFAPDGKVRLADVCRHSAKNITTSVRECVILSSNK